MIKLGGTIRHVREVKGLTQRAAARLLGVSAVHLCNVEKDKTAASNALLERCREQWGVDLYVLAWCMHGDVSKLPKSARKPMRELAKAWRSALKGTKLLPRRDTKRAEV